MWGRDTHPPPKLSEVQGFVNNNIGKQGPRELLPLLGLKKPLNFFDRLLPPVNLGHWVLLGENQSSLSSQISGGCCKLGRVPGLDSTRVTEGYYPND